MRYTGMYCSKKRNYLSYDTIMNGKDTISIVIPDVGQIDCKIKNKRVIVEEQINDLYEHIKSQKEGTHG